MKSFIAYILLFISSIIYSQNSDWVYRNPYPQNDFYAIKFFNFNTGFVAGSNGIILKNTINSNNWQLQPSGTSADLFSLFFFDLNHGFASGDSGKILYTSNSGTNWASISSGTNLAIRTITFVNPYTGFAVGDGGRVIKSTDGGMNWILNYTASANLYSLTFYDSINGFAGGVNGVFLKTTNGGTTWSSQNVGTTIIRGIAATNSNVIYLANSQNAIPRTTDGGLTWSNVTIPWQVSFYRVKFINNQTGYAAGVGGFRFMTLDGGNNWFQWNISQYCQNNDVYDFDISDTLAFLCGKGGFVVDKPRGFSSNFRGNEFGGSMDNLISISLINEDTGFTISSYRLFRTVNAGVNWSIANPVGCSTDALAGSSDLVDVKCYSPQSSYRLIHIVQPTLYNMTYLSQSTNGGISWDGPRSYSSQAMLILGICEVQGVTYISTGPYGAGSHAPEILRNDGSGWVRIYTSNTIGTAALSFANQNTGIALGYYTNPPTYLRTTDGGLTWSNNTTGSTKSIRAIQLLQSGTGYIAGDSSFLIRTTNFGANWLLISNNSNAYLFQIQFIDDVTGWVIGASRVYPNPYRLYYTNNGGQNLMQVQSLGNFQPKGMSFLNTLTGYVCGDSGVVLKTTNGGLTFVDPSASNIPDRFLLHQNYPNPFNPVTKIKFSLLNPSEGGAMSTRLIIYDVLGREVVTLLNEQLQPGSYSVDWDAANYPSGVYFYKLEVRQAGSSTGDYAQTKKMVLIK
jgi:photosystem II stability/assembly factor-like uncharacterized protein